MFRDKKVFPLGRNTFQHVLNHTSQIELLLWTVVCMVSVVHLCSMSNRNAALICMRFWIACNHRPLLQKSFAPVSLWLVKQSICKARHLSMHMRSLQTQMSPGRKTHRILRMKKWTSKHNRKNKWRLRHCVIVIGSLTQARKQGRSNGLKRTEYKFGRKKSGSYNKSLHSSRRWSQITSFDVCIWSCLLCGW